MIRRLLVPLIVLVAACQAESPSINQPVQPTARSKMKFDAPDEAEALYRMKRMAPEGTDPQRLYDAARWQMARMRLAWHEIPAAFEAAPRYEHPFEADVDLVGPRSLHRCLRSRR